MSSRMCLGEFQIKIEPMEPRHWSEVSEIYRDGIFTGQATFETTVPSWKAWNARHLPFGRFVAIAQPGGCVVGWAALSQVSKRLAYSGVAEVSVYVAKDARGQGLGRSLLERLIEESEQNGIWTLQASVFPENEASVKLHSCCGFREVGFRERIGKLDGVWRDTLLLERRSRLIDGE